jgi:hypothetical protein
MATGIQVTFDAVDPDRIARFWAEALGYVLEPPPEGYPSWEQFLTELAMPEAERDAVRAIVDPAGDRPRIYFQQVPEPKSVKNRLHLDLNPGGRRAPADRRRSIVDAEVERLVAAGATRLYDQEEYGQYHVTLADPEGNEFCVH